MNGVYALENLSIQAMRVVISRKDAKVSKTQKEKEPKPVLWNAFLCVFATFAPLREPSIFKSIHATFSILLQAVSNLLVLQAKSYPD